MYVPTQRNTPRKIRIIGGLWKRTPIAVVDEPGLRPTPDRVRETVFNWMAHLKPDLSACTGLDLFAGTGALGFELASRGAQRVVLVERSKKSLAALHALKTKLAANQIEIVAGDALTLIQRFAPQHFDLIFVDPPYASGLLRPALTAAKRTLKPEGLMYAEDQKPIQPEDAAALGLRLVRTDQAGTVCFHLLTHAEPGSNQ